MSSDDDGDNAGTKAKKQLKELRGSARGRPSKKMNNKRDNDENESVFSPKKGKNIQIDDEFDDLYSGSDDSDDDLLLVKPSKEDAKKYLDAKFIKSAVVSLGTTLICSYCAKQLTISTAFSHFRNQCKEMMIKSERMKDYREAIRTKNNRANESYKRNHGKFMAKVRDLKKEEWYIFKNKLVLPDIGNTYPRVDCLNLFFIGKTVRRKIGKSK